MIAEDMTVFSEEESVNIQQLPRGFRFHPTDEELILYYLWPRTESHSSSPRIIADVDIYKFDPWNLPEKAIHGENEWYFFSPRDRKYPNGSRPNRAAGSGYWKATGTDKRINCTRKLGHSHHSKKIGVKKALVFYKGRPPNGFKTNWIMHEYRLANVDTVAPPPAPRLDSKGSLRMDDWVLCRIYKKRSSTKDPSRTLQGQQNERIETGGENSLQNRVHVKQDERIESSGENSLQNGVNQKQNERIEITGENSLQSQGIFSTVEDVLASLPEIGNSKLLSQLHILLPKLEDNTQDIGSA